MAETFEGGAYLSADKKTWHDANGKIIPAPVGEKQPELEEAKTAVDNFALPTEKVEQTPAPTTKTKSKGA